MQRSITQGGCNLHLHFPPCLIIVAADNNAASESDTLTSFRGFMGLVKMVCQYAHTNMMKMTWYTSRYTTASRETQTSPQQQHLSSAVCFSPEFTSSVTDKDGVVVLWIYTCFHWQVNNVQNIVPLSFTLLMHTAQSWITKQCLTLVPYIHIHFHVYIFHVVLYFAWQGINSAWWCIFLNAKVSILTSSQWHCQHADTLLWIPTQSSQDPPNSTRDWLASAYSVLDSNCWLTQQLWEFLFYLQWSVSCSCLRKHIGQFGCHNCRIWSCSCPLQWDP